VLAAAATDIPLRYRCSRTIDFASRVPSMESSIGEGPMLLREEGLCRKAGYRE
jgi:hypothetical protein